MEVLNIDGPVISLWLAAGLGHGVLDLGTVARGILEEDNLAFVSRDE